MLRHSRGLLWTGDLTSQVTSQQQQAGGKGVAFAGETGQDRAAPTIPPPDPDPHTKVRRPELSPTLTPTSPGRQVLPGSTSFVQVALGDKESGKGASVCTGRDSLAPAPGRTPGDSPTLQGRPQGTSGITELAAGCGP